jgi:hypothetical protein
MFNKDRHLSKVKVLKKEKRNKVWCGCISPRSRCLCECG